MSVGTDPPHTAFPEDDCLYRLYWAGSILLPSDGHSTPRIRFWLKEVDEHGNSFPKSKVIEVIESAGSIPRLVIGSFWRNGRKSGPKKRIPTRTQPLEIIAPAKWKVSRAEDPIEATPESGQRDQTLIDQSDLPVKFETSFGMRIDGHRAHVVSATTVAGQEVIIPCYEIFRSLFAGTSDLSLALLSKTWDATEKDYVVGSQSHEGDDGIHWHIDLVPGVPPSAVPYIAWLYFDRTARGAANTIYPASVNEAPSPWIFAIPPVTDQIFRMNAHVVELKSRNALLVTQIKSFHFPLKIAAISYSIARQDTPFDNSGEIEGESQEIESSNRTPSSVSKPLDRNPTRKTFQLPSVSTKFLGLPVPKRTARSQRFIPIPKSKSSNATPTPVQVSVGAPGKRGLAAAQFTPEEEWAIENRFQAITDLVETLIKDGEINDVIDYPLVRPTPEDEPRYCAFRYSDEIRPWPWSMVRNPRRRQRLALVLQLSVGDRLVYWIETETAKTTEHYRSLAVEMVDRTSLDEGTLDSLLNLCAEKKGIWPDTIPLAKGTILAVRARHTCSGGMLSRNVILLALKRLQSARAKASK